MDCGGFEPLLTERISASCTRLCSPNTPRVRICAAPAVPGALHYTPPKNDPHAGNASTPRSVEESDGDREGKTHEDSIEQIEHGDQQPGLLARPPKRALDHGGERDA